MVKKKTKRFLLCMFSFCLFICLGVWLSFTLQANATEYELQKSYFLNETVELPEETIMYDGVAYEAKAVALMYPSGISKKGNTHTLDEAGVYTVRYEANANGKTILEEKNFRVNYDLFTTKSGKSSFAYGAHEYAPSKQGLVLSLPNNDTFTLNQIIDLSKLTKSDNIISFFFTPTSIGAADCNETQVILTDIYDPTNYVTIRFRSLSKTDGNWADPQTYIAANWAGGPTIGASHVGNKYGYPIEASITGNVGTIGSKTWSISMDYEERQIWTPSLCMYPAWMGKPIADLDDPTVTSYTWDGFTTGEVYLSIRGAQYNASTLNLVITNIAGVDLTSTTCVDTTPPTIQVDTKGYLETDLPTGLKNVPYKVFSAIAKDSYEGGIVEVTTSVYRNYGTGRQTEYSLKEGCFLPNYAGEYSIVYRSKDRFNNYAEKVITVLIEAEGEDLTLAVEGKATTGVAGQTITLVENIIVSGESGNATTRVTATMGDNTYIANENFQIVSVYAGTYMVTVEASDYLQTKTETFELVISPTEKPVVLEDAILPVYFVKGQKYSLPVLTGYNVSTATPQEIETKTYIVEDSGAEKEVKGSFTVTASDTLKIIYRAFNGNISTDKIYECKVVDVGFEDELHPTNYFVSDGSVSVAATDKEMHFTTNQDESQFAFINAVQARELSVKFNVDGKKNNFNKVNVYLSDSKNLSQCVKLTYEKDGVNTYFSVNEGAVFLIDANFEGTSADAFMLNYNNTQLTVRPMASLSVKIDKTESGEVFTGFESNQVYITFEFIGVTGESSLILYSINNQSFFNFDMDFMTPQIFADKQSGDVTPGQKVKIFGASVYDVLDNDCSVTLKVVAPSGAIMSSDDGTVLDKTCDATRDYIITVTEYGNYSVTITGKDSSGNSVNFKYGFTVVENEPPTISVATNTDYGKVGKEIKIRGYGVSDNTTGADKLKVYVYITDPDCVVKQMTEMKFKPTKKGTYTVYYYCSDAMGNTSVVGYEIVVS